MSKTKTFPNANSAARPAARKKPASGKSARAGATPASTPAARLRQLESQVRSLGAVQAVIEFTPEGNIVDANEIFLGAVGYRLDEIVGKHHGMFLTDADRRAPEYREFWHQLGRGKPMTGQCRRVTKSGQEIWLQATYNPVIDLEGNVERVIKYAIDITAERQRMADFESQLKSINAYQAVIEFKLDGTIVQANQNFLDCVGYSASEVVGRHHRIFVDPNTHQTPEYQGFWERLGRGSADSGQYKRFGKGGREIWLQASYCPIFDAEGRVAKVVKYATEITAAKQLEAEMGRVVTEVGTVMRAVAEGDLELQMQGQYQGEFASLRDAVNRCVGDLNSLVGQIRASSSAITASSTEIAQGNLDLSQRTEQQAASIEETASSMEEITGTVRQNADNAKQANQLASNAREQAERGGTVVTNAIAAMRSINEASNKIADIIGVIDEIAFQTNLLALNAAVEAARAGEQGRGFAVVASEVRNLAQRSAGAAKEIKALIKDSVTRVEEGSRLVNDSGETLSTIVSAVKKVSDIIAEIAEASVEQSVGIDKVNQAITEMDQAVQQNAALVEQVAAASGAMDTQSQALSTLMGRFRITEEAEREAMQSVPTAPSSRIATLSGRRPGTAATGASPATVQKPALPAGRLAARPPARPRPDHGTQGVSRLAERVEHSEEANQRVTAGAGRWEEF